MNSNSLRDAPPLYYGLQFIRSGEITISVNNQMEQRAKGPISFLSCPEFTYNYFTPDNGTREHYWVCFQGERVKDYIAGGLFTVDPKNMLVRIENSMVFFEQMKELIHLVRNGVQHEKSVLILENLLLLMHKTKASCMPPRRYEMEFDQLLSQIKKQPENDWDFSLWAKNLHISLNYFNRLFRVFYHTSPHDFVLCCRMAKAADLLITTYYSIAEVSYSVGIENELYFSRLFKKKYGVSPKNYRDEFLSL